jgi:hypothetical protein
MSKKSLGAHLSLLQTNLKRARSSVEDLMALVASCAINWIFVLLMSFLMTRVFMKTLIEQSIARMPMLDVDGWSFRKF